MQEAGQGARLASFLESVLETGEISQAELASRLQISQSSVSRALHKQPQRQGRARSCLVMFMQQGGMEKGFDRIGAVARRVWDGSEEHAEALARIMAACEGLRPARRKGAGDDR